MTPESLGEHTNAVRRRGEGPLDEFLEVVRRYEVPLPLIINAIRDAYEPQGLTAPLTESAADFLAAHSGLGPATLSVEAARAQHAKRRLVQTLTDLRLALTVEQAAARLSVPTATVRRRVRDRSLFGYRLGQTLYLPDWQFVDGQSLPHLGEVLRAVPHDLHPASIHGFFTTTDDDLEGLTRAQWLASGGDAALVVRAARSLTAW